MPSEAVPRLFNKVVDHGDRYKKFTEEDVIASEDIIKEVALYQTTYAASNSELVRTLQPSNAG